MLAELQAADPRSVGPYVLLGRLGSGGMGQVYLGRSPAGRLVAVKVIRPDLAGEPGFRTRFAREVNAARNVSGLFTALVVDADVSGPVPWLATLYVPGPSLSEAVAGQGPLPTAAVLTLASGLAQGLQAIHAAGVVHRDLKPANVLLARDGPRVIDFGISRAAEVTETTALTQTGMVLGSPGYMSPEQAEGASVGPPSDVFSLGAVLTFAATGEGPFGTGSTPQLLYRVVHSPPDIARLPREIRSLVERCLVKDPGLRPTTSDLIAALGAGRPAADWLSTALPLYPPLPADSLSDTPAPADSLSDTPPPAQRLSYAPVPAGTRADAESTPLEHMFALPQPGDAADRRRRRDRRRLTLVTAAAAAVLTAASASAALTLDSAGGAHRSSTDSSQHPTVPAEPSPRAAGAASPRASRRPAGSGPTQHAVSQISTASPPPGSPTTGPPTPTPSTPTPTPSTPTPTPSTPTPSPSTPTPSPSGPTPTAGAPAAGTASTMSG
ncbi:MAG TPA: serine/threonine-protein kinase [Streptosporangiaceae bacterium]|nr:serine/threonine-protein kinase [Streptosporangiaceae bacterium]